MKIYALDTSGGKAVWKIELPLSKQAAPEKIHWFFCGGTILLWTPSRVTAYSADSGQVLWQAALTVLPFPFCEHNILLWPHHNGLTALDIYKGTQLWWNDNAQGNSFFSAPPVADSRQIFFGRGGFFAAYSRRTGNELWGQKIPGTLHSSPLIMSSLVFILIDKHTLWALEKSTGKVVYRYQSAHPEDTLFLQAQERFLYIGDKRGHVFALDCDCLQIVWQRQATPASVEYNDFVSTAADKFLVLSYIQKGFSGLCALEPKSGEAAWQFLPQESEHLLYHNREGQAEIIEFKDGHLRVYQATSKQLTPAPYISQALSVFPERLLTRKNFLLIQHEHGWQAYRMQNFSQDFSQKTLPLEWQFLFDQEQTNTKSANSDAELFLDKFCYPQEQETTEENKTNPKLYFSLRVL